MKLSKLSKILGLTIAFAISSQATLLIQQNKALGGAGTSILYTGESLFPGQFLISPNGQYKAVLQYDGNFILYNSFNIPLWSSNTFDTGAKYIVMQYDCDLVIYGFNAIPIWATFTTIGSSCRLAVEDDGNLVIYRGDNLPLWAKGTRLRG
ncbi:hypothetical protein [Nostoc sp. ChiQUE01b]|uniref:hypothetical protein n=1 Tax=Nostoc sp. ChiQUE01b TaxID=3075376 RepID=UPI002AD37979|nr:hypothetical protein [Nostoc sp. ChiQUE01b]MDZ8260193.1 hypothetical protein [Nostoc sp. ChiQUE01b]